MHDLYKKIINGEVDINDLSPIDLIKLIEYLKEINIELLNNLEKEY